MSYSEAVSLAPPTTASGSSSPQTQLQSGLGSNSSTTSSADNTASTTRADNTARTSSSSANTTRISSSSAIVYPHHLPPPSSVSPEPTTSVSSGFGTFRPFPFTQPGLTFKPFSPVSKTRKTLQIRSPICPIPAQPLRADDIKKIHEAILTLDKNSPLPQRDSFATKRKRNTSSPGNSAPRKPVKSGKIFSYFKKPSDTPDDILTKTLPVRQQLLSLVHDIDSISERMSDSILLSPPSDQDWTDDNPTLGAQFWTDNASQAPILNLATIIDTGDFSNTTNPSLSTIVNLQTDTHLTEATRTPIPVATIATRPQGHMDLATLLGPKYTTTLEGGISLPPKPQVTTSIHTATLPPISINNILQGPPPSPNTHTDLATLLGPRYAISAFPDKNIVPVKHVSFQTPVFRMLNEPISVITHHPLTPSHLNIPTTTTVTSDYVDLATLLGPKYLKTLTNNVERSTPETPQESERTYNSNANVTDQSSILSLQNRLDILPEALLPWRQARSFLSAQAKAECRADHIDQLRTTGRTPPWALNLEATPGFLDRELESLVDLKRTHGSEVLRLAKDLLLSRARVHGNTGRASLLTCEILYRDVPESWEGAKDLLAQLVGSDRAKCQTSLTRRSEYLATHPVSDSDISTLMRNGPTAPSRRPVTRSRSRSPRRARSPTTRRDGPSRRPLAPRDNKRPAQNTSAPKDTNTFRQPKDNKGKAKNRGTNRSRGNQSAGPSNSENRSNQNRQSRARRDLDLTKAEQDLINAFRNKNGGQN